MYVACIVGKGESSHCALMQADGSVLLDLMFSTQFDAYAYALRKGLPLM